MITTTVIATILVLTVKILITLKLMGTTINAENTNDATTTRMQCTNKSCVARPRNDTLWIFEPQQSQ